jgi:hypothetical protein
MLALSRIKVARFVKPRLSYPFIPLKILSKMSEDTDFKQDNENGQPVVSPTAAQPKIDKRSPKNEELLDEANRQFVKILYKTFNFVGRTLHVVPERPAEAFKHSVETTFGGFTIGLALYFLQFTLNASVNEFVRYTRAHFIEHYRTVPLDILTVAFLIVSLSLWVITVLAKPIRRFFISPVFSATGHGFGLTAGMVLSLGTTDAISGISWNDGVGSALGAAVLTFGLSVIIFGFAEVMSSGLPDFFEDRTEPYVELKPNPDKANLLTTILLLMISAVFGYLSWSQLKDSAAEHAKHEKEVHSQEEKAKSSSPEVAKKG